MRVVLLAIIITMTVSSQAQVMQRRVIVPQTVPTAPQKTQDQATDADKAAGQTDAAGNPVPPPSDPAGTPPPSDTPPVATPAPDRAGPANERRGTLLPAPQVDQRAAVASPDAAMITWYDRIPGCAKRISIASLTRIYVIGCSNSPDTLVFRWMNDHFEPAGVSAASIAAAEGFRQGGTGPNNPAFTGVFPIVSAEIADPNAMQEKAVGGGWMWAIKSPSGNHWGGMVMRTNCLPLGSSMMGERGDCDFKSFGGGYMKRIAAGLTDGIAWAVAEDGKVYRQVNQGDGWLKRGGCATSIANAGGDNVWIIGCDPPDANGNRKILRWRKGAWQVTPGAGVEIALQPNGIPWVLTADGAIWRRKSP
jgi:hypothetical protein